VGEVARRAVRLLALAALPSAALGHRLDEYLQATVVNIEPEAIGLSINLTPGIEVADEVLARIDWNGDGLIAESEGATYAELLRRDLALRLDRGGVELELVAAAFPPTAELVAGTGIIQLEFVASALALAAGPHVLAFENRHFAGVGVYLFNAALPRSSSIDIARQKRNDDQSAGEIEFTLTDRRAAAGR
jgi:hypothetical protein